MKARIDCIPCLCGQALRVISAAVEDDWTRRRVLKGILEDLSETDLERAPAELVAEVVSKSRLKEADPMAAARAAAQKTVTKKILPGVQERLEGLSDKDERLCYLATAAAAGNVIDALILEPQLDLPATFFELVEAGFAKGDVKELCKALEGADDVLYLLDNAGEVLIDVLLIEELRARERTVRAVSRHSGLLHDATANEAVKAGLKGVLEIPAEESVTDSGVSDESPTESKYGLPPDIFATAANVLGLTRSLATPALQGVIDDSGLVISKGSANLQTFRHPKVPVAHLIHAKCEPVAKHLGVKPGQLVLRIDRPSSGPA